MKNCKRGRGFGPLIFLVVLAAATAVVMLLWNWLMPAIFGLGVISFWQSLGLIVLSRLLLGGFGKWAGMHGHGGHGKKGHPFHQHSPREMYAMREKFRGMSREERDAYIRKHMEERERMWKGDCGGGAQNGANEDGGKE